MPFEAHHRDNCFSFIEDVPSICSRDAKDHVKAKGKMGRMLVSLMGWSETMGTRQSLTMYLAKLGLQSAPTQLEHALYISINNFTAGHAKDVS